jgi:hypothetical protein
MGGGSPIRFLSLCETAGMCVVVSAPRVTSCSSVGLTHSVVAVVSLGDRHPEPEPTIVDCGVQRVPPRDP